MTKKTALPAAILIFILTAAMLAGIFGGMSVFAAETTDGISSVTLANGTVSIEVTLSGDWLSSNSGAQIYIFTFEPYESVSSLNEKKPVGFAPAKRTVTIETPLLSDDGTTKLYSKFLAAKMENTGEYSAVGTAVYIGNPGTLASVTSAYPTYSSKKGLNIQLPADAQLLGVEHTIVTVAMDDYLLGIGASDAAPDNSLACDVDGTSVYFNRSKLTALDNKIKSFTDAGIEVYLQTVLTAPDDESLSILYHDGVSGTASLYFPNITSKDSYKMVRAFFELLAQRYGDPSGENGFAGAYIIGFEVNTPQVYNDAGSLPSATYLYSYAALVRIADTALKSNYSNGRVFISVSNRWAGEGGAREFLSSFIAATSYGGDFDFGVSASIYASDNSNSAVWKETDADNTQNSAYITPINAGVLMDFMTASENKTSVYGKAAVRNVIIGDFGVSGDPSDSVSLANQAASYAYMYYYVMQNNDIDALIYHRHVDSAYESGRYYGLYAAEYGTVYTPSAAKPLHDIFRKIDIEEPAEITKTLMKLGASFTDTNTTFYDGTLIPARKIIEAIPLGAASMPNASAKTVFDFDSGNNFDFFAAEGASYVLCRPTTSSNGASETALYASLDGSNALDYMGVGVDLTGNADFEHVGYIRLTCMTVIPGAESGDYVTVMLRLTGKNAGLPVVYEGIAQVAAGGWGDFTFDIREFTDEAGAPDSLRIWVKPEIATNADDEYELYIGKISVYGDGSMALWLKVLLIILTVLVLAAGALAVWYYLKRRDEMKRQNALPRSQRPVGYGSDTAANPQRYGQPRRSPNDTRPRQMQPPQQNQQGQRPPQNPNRQNTQNIQRPPQQQRPPQRQMNPQQNQQQRQNPQNPQQTQNTRQFERPRQIPMQPKDDGEDNSTKK